MLLTKYAVLVVRWPPMLSGGKTPIGQPSDTHAVNLTSKRLLVYFTAIQGFGQSFYQIWFDLLFENQQERRLPVTKDRSSIKLPDWPISTWPIFRPLLVMTAWHGTNQTLFQNFKFKMGNEMLCSLRYCFYYVCPYLISIWRALFGKMQ